MNPNTSMIIGTIFFLILWLISSFIIMFKVTKGVNDAQLRSEYRGMSFGLTFLAAFCMWLMWISVFMHQMNPLISPIIKPEI